MELFSPFALSMVAALSLNSFADELTLVPKDGKGQSVVIDSTKIGEVTLDGKVYLVQPKAENSTARKAKAIKLPRLDLMDCPISEAIEYLRIRGIELDDGKEGSCGINFVLKDVGGVVIPHLALRDTSIFEIVGFIAELTDTKVEYRESAIVFSKKE